ncbi:MAG TPA: helix-turn-helix transcriptional regulator [Longimicrobiaceae bacterium]|nr:helix-turn-helix transcriptional regulator [Longimicrobiaceae bacterium]
MIDMVLVPNGRIGGWAPDFPGDPLCSDLEVREAYERFRVRRRPVIWIADDVAPLVALAKDAVLLKSEQRLLLLDEPSPGRKDLLHLLFRVVVAPGRGVSLLVLDELREVLGSEHRTDLFIAGVLERAAGVVVLYRGNLAPVVVPLAWFDRRGLSPKPNFGDFEITDYGHSVRFGKYEASTDAILYEYDADYRHRAKERQLKLDDSLGGCIRRLRLMRGLSREDFPGVSEKQIARIERGEIAKVRAGTLAKIASALKVQPDEITSY